ncbi:MotA/TolQ/ExbB proton channel domain-containing protein [Nostoc sp. DSM 114161]
MEFSPDIVTPHRSIDLLRLSSESPLFIVLIIISFLVVTFSTWLSSQPFTFRPFGLSDIIQQLTLPLFISLLLERSLEVFITTWRSPFIEELDIEIQRQKIIVDEKLKLAKEQNQQSNIADLKSNRASILPPEGMSLEQQIIQNFIQSQEEVLLVAKPELDDLNLKERQRAAYKADTRTIALWTSLLVGLLISAIGVRSIEPLVIIDSNNQIQLVIFRSLDALLTGGLIAGGSEGIHKIIQVFINFMEATSQQIKDNRLP